MDDISFEEYIRGYKNFLRIFEFKDEVNEEEMYKRYLELKRSEKNERDSAELQ